MFFGRFVFLRGSFRGWCYSVLACDATLAEAWEYSLELEFTGKLKADTYAKHLTNRKAAPLTGVGRCHNV